MTYATCAQDAQSCYYTSSLQSCGANKNCTGAGVCGCNGGYTNCSGSCVNVNNDNNNCGGCNQVCPTLSSPSSDACGTGLPGKCQGEVGGSVRSGGGTVALDPNCDTIYAVKATMPPGGGTFVGVNALVGSTDSMGTTQFVLALYSDNAGVPGNRLFWTDYQAAANRLNNPSAPVTISSANSGGSYDPSFNGQLAGNTSYWAYLKAGTNCPTSAIAALSTAPCVMASWMNVDPPISWFNPKGACPSGLNLYVVATFP
jgi:hypothetical protein